VDHFQFIKNGEKQGNMPVSKDLSLSDIFEYSSIGNIGILTVDLGQKSY